MLALGWSGESLPPFFFFFCMRMGELPPLWDESIVHRMRWACFADWAEGGVDAIGGHGEAWDDQRQGRVDGEPGCIILQDSKLGVFWLVWIRLNTQSNGLLAVVKNGQ